LLYLLVVSCYSYVLYLFLHSFPTRRSSDLLNIIKLSKASRRKMVQNLGWAAGYNIVAIPLAAGVLYNVGFVITPAVGAAVMSLSTIICAINAQLLKID